MKNVEGVSNATVNLDDGEAVISLEDPNGVSLARLRNVIREQGFTPEDAAVRVRAVVRKTAGGLVLEVPGSGEVFRPGSEASDLAPLEARLNQPVVVRGRVEEERDRIRVTSVKADPGASE